MSVRHVPEAVLAVQIAASNPDVSAWVTANAGSGKTYVLTRRVIRLLLEGNAPAKILCLTFTKAAAAHMANEVFATLGRWATLDAAALDAEILVVEGRKPDARRRTRARRLFAEALETPGGLKVQTIHAFCTGLLHQFPFEAHVPVSFEVMEDRAESDLFDSLRVAVMLEAAQKPDSAIGCAVAIAMTAAADVTFADVVREALGERDAIDAWLARVGTLDNATVELSRTLGIDPQDSSAQINAEVCGGPILPSSEWPSAAAALQRGSSNDCKQADRLARAATLTGIPRCTVYESVFFTGDGKPRKDICTKPLAKNEPGLAGRLAEEQERLVDLRERRRAVMARDRSMALVTITKEIADRYRAEKERRGLLDYDDLVDKTRAVFTRVPSSWILYKLDLGIDHLLVDEAQDTSPKQWDVIRKLVEEFTAGAGARGSLKRTIFAVGDEKQSIYSFQGAQPHLFAENQRHFRVAHEESEQTFAPLRFEYSFRSAPDVLRAVDAVFGRPEAFRGLSADPVQTVHQAVRSAASGHVEIWEIVKPDEKPEIEGWDRPFDESSDVSPQVRLAGKIAATVQGWIERGEKIEGKRITAGDVLILVRGRGPLFAAIIRALKDARVDVAGADRLILAEHIAVMDLLSLADALLLQEDDLALAEVLKSPLFALSEEQLLDLAWQRPGSLRDALRTKAADNPAYASAADRLDRLAHAARAKSPFAFYAELLGPQGGRRQFLARLGHEANDALDEFLALALDYERREAPSLQGFVAWMRAGTVEVKRDMDIVRNEVRVMTVHGAKGLEAPIVILADTIGNPAGPRQPNLLVLDAASEYAGAAGALVWAGKKADDPPPMEAARTLANQATEDEHRRLLYVAMTRARDRLIVCGARGVKEKPAGCWYDLVHDALTPTAEKIDAANGEGARWVWRQPSAEAVEDVADVQPESAVTNDGDTSWLYRDAPAGEQLATSVLPSQAISKRAPVRVSADKGDGLARGIIIHRLLQSLPEYPPDTRRDAGRRFLVKSKPLLTEAETDALLDEVIAVLHHPDFAPLFALGSRAEIPIVGRLSTVTGTPYSVSGRIDRLVMTGSEVLIADFKSEQIVPDLLPNGYVTQLARYWAVIRTLYPDHAVRAALIWTQGPRLVEIPAEMLDSALEAFQRGAP